MKKILNYIAAMGLAAGFSACETDLEETVFNAMQATPAALQQIDPSYVLDAQKSNETVFTLNWSEPDFGYQAVATNYIEMDFNGNNFQKPTVLAAIGKGGKQAFTHNVLNNILMKFLEDNGKELVATDFEIRISSVISQDADTLFSNVIKTTLTPFLGEREYPFIAVRGDLSGWDFKKSQKIYSAEEDENYAAMVYFDGKAKNGWKLCGAEDWNVTDGNWGLKKDAKVSPEESPITLYNHGESTDMRIYSHNSYYVEFNKVTGVLKMTKPHDSWGIVGDHNGWVSNDTKLTFTTETDKFGALQHILTATMDMNAGNKWKIRPDEKWADDKGPGQLKFEGDVIDNGDGNFCVEAAGNYTIKWYYNKVEQKLTVTKN